MKSTRQDERDANAAQEMYRYDAGGLGQVVTFANVLITIVLIAGIYFDNKSATVAVVSGVAYFAFSTGLTVLALSRTLTDIITNRQQQITVRELQRLQFYAIQPMVSADPIRIEYTEPARLPQAPSFVPAIAEPDDSAKREAVAWILQLYQANGEPDPKKVLMQSDKEKPGRVRVAAPSRPARQYLIDRRIIHDLGNGFRVNLTRIPTITAAMEYLK